MGRLEPGQDPGPVQKIVDQGIDRDQLHADFEPPRANVSSADQNAGQRHGEHLVGDAVDIAQWLNQRITRLGQTVRSGLVVRLVQPVIDPADQIAVGNVANEQVEAVGNLVEVAVSQAMGWQRAGGDVVRLGAGAARLLVSAGMKIPIGFQLRASWLPGQILADRAPSRLAMPTHVICGNLVRDPLKAEIVDQPVEQRRAVVPFNCGTSNLGHENLRSSRMSQRNSRPGESGEWRKQRQPYRDRLVLSSAAPEPDLQRGWRPSTIQISDTSLRWASVSPSMYRWVVWIDR